MSRHLAAVAAAVLAAALLAGCGSSGEAASKSATPSSPSSSASPTPFAPNVGATALSIGQTRDGKAFRTTVYEVKQHVKAPTFAPPEPGNKWVIARAKMCSRNTSPETAFSTDWTDYVIMDDNDGQYDASGVSWGTWPPLPQYPRDRKIAPGTCVTGWMLFTAPRSVKITKIGLTDGESGFSAEWKLT
jgi:hypothetical protein